MELFDFAVRIVAVSIIIVAAWRVLPKWRPRVAPHQLEEKPAAEPAGTNYEEVMMSINRKILARLEEIAETNRMVVQATYGTVAPLVSPSREEEIRIEEKARNLMRRYPDRGYEECVRLAKEISKYGGGA